MQYWKTTLWILCLSINGFHLALAQEKAPSPLLQKLKDFQIQPSLNFQFWGSFGTDFKIYNDEKGEYEKVDNRFNAMVRRLLVSLKGHPYPGLQFKVTGSYDFVGRDVLVGQNRGF